MIVFNYLITATLTLPLGYVGPGPGLSMLGALLSFILTLGIALWAVALWPLRIMLRKRRERRAATEIQTHA